MKYNALEPVKGGLGGGWLIAGAKKTLEIIVNLTEEIFANALLCGTTISITISDVAIFNYALILKLLDLGACPIDLATLR